jgi:plastocyanin
MHVRGGGRVAVLLIALVGSAFECRAQSLLERSPNLSGGWVGSPGVAYFNFMHRFNATAAPERKVLNTPTFLLGVGLPRRTLVAASYATNSRLTPRYPNEWEFFVRHSPLLEETGGPLDVAAQIGYNLSAEGLDGEVSLARRMGPARGLLAGRVLSDPGGADGVQFAVAAGATFRVGRYFALAGDLANLLDKSEEDEIAWSAGVHLAIPYAPHTLSIHATNANTTTLQGASRGGQAVRYGFEFTVPLSVGRWFAAPPPAAASGAPEQGAAVGTGAATPASGAVFQASLQNSAFGPARIEIRAGTVVEWVNRDPVAHTVTAADRSFDSGSIAPGATWRQTFTRPGTFQIVCLPHPFMTATVIVQ